MAQKRKSVEQWQIKKLHTLKSKLGISEEDYRDTLQSFANVNSSTDLNYNQANDLINHWEKAAVEQGLWKQADKTKKEFDEFENRGGDFATPAQLRMIVALWNEKSFVEDPTKRRVALNKFINNITGVLMIDWIHKQHVQKIIKAIKSIKTKTGDSND